MRSGVPISRSIQPGRESGSSEHLFLHVNYYSCQRHQVLQGLSFLENAGFTHAEFTESCVMAGLDGNVKIGESMVLLLMNVSNRQKADRTGAVRGRCYLYSFCRLCST